MSRKSEQFEESIMDDEYEEFEEMLELMLIKLAATTDITQLHVHNGILTDELATMFDTIH